MSQAIPAFTPPPPSYPYQGNPQQQVSAALASSWGMPGDSIAPVIVGVTVGGLLTATAVTLAVKHFSTSGDKPKPVQARSLTSKPGKREGSAQVESAPPSNEEMPQPPLPPLPKRQPTLSFEPTLEIPHPPSVPQYITIPGLPGFIDPADGIYRERQIKGDRLCGTYALKTILYKFFGKEKMITKEEEKVLGPGLRTKQLEDFARRKGLDPRIYNKEELDRTSIDDADAFIIGRERSPRGLHAVALVRMTPKGGFHLSDSGNQDKREIYWGTADEARRHYEVKNNRTIRQITTFRCR
jgi:hypothetical protein